MDMTGQLSAGSAISPPETQKLTTLWRVLSDVTQRPASSLSYYISRCSVGLALLLLLLDGT